LKDFSGLFKRKFTSKKYIENRIPSGELFPASMLVKVFPFSEFAFFLGAVGAGVNISEKHKASACLAVCH